MFTFGHINNVAMRLFCIVMLSVLSFGMTLQAQETTNAVSDREYWVATMDQIARPVIWNLAAGTLHKNMPAESVALIVTLGVVWVFIVTYVVWQQVKRPQHRKLPA